MAKVYTINGRKKAETEEPQDIRTVLLTLFFLACALILFGAIGDLIVWLMKWSGYLLMAFVLTAFAARFIFAAWPEWATRTCKKLSDIWVRM